jgi:hypothetical protein
MYNKTKIKINKEAEHKTFTTRELEFLLPGVYLKGREVGDDSNKISYWLIANIDSWNYLISLKTATTIKIHNLLLSPVNYTWEVVNEEIILKPCLTE